MCFPYKCTKFERYILKQGTRVDLRSLGKKKYHQYVNDNNAAKSFAFEDN